MIANGAITVGQPGTQPTTPTAITNYTLLYVQVSDPWTGYAISQPASANGTLGWGGNTLLRYGYDVLGSGGIAWVRPDGTTVNNAEARPVVQLLQPQHAASQPGLWSRKLQIHG